MHECVKGPGKLKEFWDSIPMTNNICSKPSEGSVCSNVINDENMSTMSSATCVCSQRLR
jgi:hypothetical protein